jgi:NADPH-dependent 2,4-dienoyl-CoA reductase/sulfur reductase-like enzyme
MNSDKIYVSTALEPDHDWPVADIVYDGVQWASVTFLDGAMAVEIYGHEGRPTTIPVEDAIESLVRAESQLRELIGRAEPR